jgi:polysaccharide export outer membrane protein
MRHPSSLAAIGWTILLTALLMGCAKPPLTESPPEPVSGERVPYVIGIPDVLTVHVWRNKELTARVVVRSDGMISVPLLGDVQAEGLTPLELTEVISAQLSEYISAPDVTVTVERADSQSATVVGAVGRSGVVRLERQKRVLEAIAEAGGFNTWARRSHVLILRQTPEGQVMYGFNFGAFVSGKAPNSNIVLEPGDTVVVPD